MSEAKVLRKPGNLVWQESVVSKEERRRRNGHGSCVLWLTGLSGAGKSTLAQAVSRQLENRGVSSYVLDGDNLRHGLNRGLGFSSEGRRENIRRVGEVAKMFVDSGLIVLAALISPWRRDRECVRNSLEPGEFVEVFVDCPLEICEERDPKGLYQKVRQGEILNFTGISAPYEPPLAPELTIETHSQGLEEAVDQIMSYLEEQKLIQKQGDNR
ncbi:adenylyl-sulfate kinase [Kroppenstedtia pulmonis]|uniref:Adenylyl-sulfate kinase n=1 Tax=Kroppenstedtia pulmonis TaxID=1380685 RepID=A0A7D3XPY7_9BACL|nr:adenylyl-sulfate kinase [Kroppenstedtia pulmonis]QKG83942.1 adenylyl-sulfate kinase [Kroppenstedtia pulmonis]